MKKQLLCLSLAVVLFFSLTANAIAPIILGPGIELITASGTAVALRAATARGVSAIWSGVVASIGAMVLYANMKDGAGNAVRVPLSGSAATVPPQPTGALMTTSSVTSWDYSYSSPEAACAGQNWANIGDGSCHFDHISAQFSDHANCVGSPCGATIQVFATGTSCPAGYTTVSGICTLSDARVAIQDHNCDLSRSGATYSYYSGDPDCSAAGAIKGAIDTGAFSVAGVDEFNNPVTTTITPNADGSTTFKQTVQSEDAAGNTMITTKTLTINSSGAPSTVNQIQQPGTVNNSSTNQTATTTTNTSLSSGQPITFPNDYAKEATQTANKDLLTSIDKSLKDTDKDPPKDTQFTPSQRANAEPYFTNAFSGLKAWSFPSHTSTCPVIRFHVSYFTDDIVIDGHCAIVANNAAMISTVMLLLFGLMAMFIVLGA